MRMADMCEEPRREAAISPRFSVAKATKKLFRGTHAPCANRITPAFPIAGERLDDDGGRAWQPDQASQAAVLSLSLKMNQCQTHEVVGARGGTKIVVRRGTE